MQPDPARRADVGDLRDRVDGAGERRAGGRHDRHRGDSGRQVGVERLGEGAGMQPTPASSGIPSARPSPAPAPPPRGRPSSAPPASSRWPPRARATPSGGERRQRTLASRGECRHVGDRATARECAAGAGKPINSPTQRTAWSSTSVAAPAQTARLTSKQAARGSPMTPISSPDEPTNAKKRGRGCAIECRGPGCVVEGAKATSRPREPAPSSPRSRPSIGLARAEPVEAPPGARRRSPRRAQHLLARGVEAKDGLVGDRPPSRGV